jgi:ribonuclease J
VAGFTRAGGTTLGRVPTGRHFMRREGLSPIGDAALSERRQLAETGVAVAVVVVQQGGGKLLSGPTLFSRGLESAEVAALPLAAQGARLALEELSEAVRGDDERVREAVVAGARRVFKQLLGTRPGILPVVVRM